MNLIMHIGTPKTGTTTIQKMLFENKVALKSNGFHFLQCAGLKNNRALPACCVNDRRKDDFFTKRGIADREGRLRFREKVLSQFRSELASLGDDIHTVIVSSEQFSERLKSGAEVERFYDVVSPYFSNIKILCWLREQSEMAGSFYSTALRSGGTVCFDDFLEKCRPDNQRYNYYEMLNRWSDVFGIPCVEARIFSRDAFCGGDLICDFISCVSLDLLQVIDRNISSKNTSINVAGQRLLLVINRCFGGWLKKYRSRKRLIVRAIDSRFSGRGFRPSVADYQRIYDSFYESNRLLNEKYFRREGPLFEFSPPKS